MAIVPFKDFNLNAVAALAAALYLAVVMLAAVSIANPIWRRKIRLALPVLLIALVFVSVSFAIRYYNEVFLTRGIVVQKDVECKYEPIDKAMAYYNLKEGNVVVIMKTRGGWRQIRRLDGKIAWVPEGAVQEI